MLKIKDTNKFVTGILIIVIVVAIIITILWNIISLFTKKDDAKVSSNQQTENDGNVTNESQTVEASNNENLAVLNEWNLKLVNKSNSVDRNYVPELQELDDGVMFDKRVLPYIKDMINAMYKEKITKIWVQSAYRSYDRQEELFNRKVKYYLNEGETQEEAERLAQTVVQRPEMSEHNLGLAADFNTVSTEFEETKAFEWLTKNAQDYGFVLRYPKDKQDITGITYEPWHWRYVGVEHAKVMKEKGYCLEEYVEYLKGTEQV